LIASSVLLLLVVGAFVAFDSWPTQAAAVPEDVSIGAPPRAVVVRTRVTGHGTAARRHALIGARRARARRAALSAAAHHAAGGRVLAALPAPSVGPRHLPDPPHLATAAPPRDARPAHPASVAPLPLPLPLPLLGQPIVPPASELPTGSATLDDVVKRIGDTKPAGAR
jgi:hypothetical protein